ncbi:glycosyltransferase family 39 protein [Hyphomonas sp.]|uniref:glycosyltransferase family 39 protein n=1 Tax=Hyphomonas sp. TaxID=87 RepID=UPI003F7262F8
MKVSLSFRDAHVVPVWDKTRLGWRNRAANNIAAQRLAFFAISLIALTLRLWHVNTPSLWMDEAIAVGLAELPIEAILFEQLDNHPPLFFLVQHVWQAMFPDPAMARIPAALIGVATVYVVMAALRDLVSLRAAIIAGLLLALSTGHTYYSQEVRMYALVLFGLALATWGGVGQAEPGRHAPRVYAALYVVGGAIAIYTQVIGLLAMGLIGFAALAGGLMAGGGKAFARSWLFRNLVLFVLILPWTLLIPGFFGFTGLHQPPSVITSLWYYNTMTGFPGLGFVGNLLVLVLYALACWGILRTWISGRKAFSLTLAGLVMAYPLALFVLSFDRPLISVRTLIPSALGVCMAAGIGLDGIRRKRLVLGIAAIILSASLASTAHQLAYPIKPENYKAAYRYLDGSGYGDAPILNCIDMSTAAAWYARPQAKIYLYQRGGLVHFAGPQYWQAARMSMRRYSVATSQEIDAFVGGRLLVDGGFDGAFGQSDKLVFMRPFCADRDMAEIESGLTQLGFTLQSERLIDEGAPPFQIMAMPHTWVTLYVREE